MDSAYRTPYYVSQYGSKIICFPENTCSLILPPACQAGTLREGRCFVIIVASIWTQLDLERGLLGKQSGFRKQGAIAHWQVSYRFFYVLLTSDNGFLSQSWTLIFSLDSGERNFRPRILVVKSSRLVIHNLHPATHGRAHVIN